MSRALTVPRRVVLAGALALFAALVYGPSLALPFIGDDYVFLEHTTGKSLLQLWSGPMFFGWFRPWSRELHFWSMQRLAGDSELAFRLVGLGLWLAALLLYAVIVRRVAGGTAAAIATLGVCALSLWGAPLLWISGSQDLWMLVFALASIAFFGQRRTILSALALVLALLSKETAAVVPAVLLAYAVFIDGDRFPRALRRTSVACVVLIVWLVIHPTLMGRWDTRGTPTLELEHRLPLVTLALRTVLSSINLDRIPRPAGITSALLLRVVGSAAVLALGALLVFRSTKPRPASETPARSVRWFAISWAMVGWLPLFAPSIGWHGYYGCLGALGAWLFIATFLERSRTATLIALVALAILRGAAGATLSWDWGTEWYQRRAGKILAGVREQLMHQHPALPPRSRLYFAHMPNNIGFVAGSSPAIRVWYRDSTLQAGFYSYYRPRASEVTEGQDLFFRFDTTRGLVEVREGRENVLDAVAHNPAWEADHEVLAMMFLRNGEVARAAQEFEKLATLEHRADACVYAGVCWAEAGRAGDAELLFREAARRMGVEMREIATTADKLRRELPALTSSN